RVAIGARVAMVPLVPLVALPSFDAVRPVLSRGAVLSATDHRGITVTESVIHPRVRRVVEVLVVDDGGRTLLAVTRVALTARRDDDFSEALPMLALVALVPLVAFVALLPVDSRRPLQPYRACIALVALVAFHAVRT